jgi:Flp pilus assembly pilin Flp
VTILLWLVNLAIKFGANSLLQAVDQHDAAAVGNSLLLTLGAGMLIEGVVALNRALRTNSQIIWAKGKDGRPHTASPFLDNLQSRMTGTHASPLPSLLDALRSPNTRQPRDHNH